MEPRLNYTERSGEILKVLYGAVKYLSRSTIEKPLLHLIELRVSQINGCAFCVDMHAKDLRHAGETEQRIFMLSVWRDSPVYTEREKAALEWAEAVTLVADTQVPDSVYEAVSRQFSEQELVDLTFAVTTINTWNRLNVAFRTPAGNYVPGQYASAAG